MLIARALSYCLSSEDRSVIMIKWPRDLSEDGESGGQPGDPGLDVGDQGIVRCQPPGDLTSRDEIRQGHPAHTEQSFRW